MRPAEARAFLVRHLHLHQYFPAGAAGVRAMLAHLRCVQIDPLNPMGTNHDLVTMARVPDVKRGQMGHHLRGHAFEHWAKERYVLLPHIFSLPAFDEARSLCPSSNRYPIVPDVLAIPLLGASTC